jgi:hypothetical protein
MSSVIQQFRKNLNLPRYHKPRESPELPLIDRISLSERKFCENHEARNHNQMHRSQARNHCIQDMCDLSDC